MTRAEEIKQHEDALKDLRRQEKDFLEEADRRKDELIKRWKLKVVPENATVIENKTEEK